MKAEYNYARFEEYEMKVKSNDGVFELYGTKVKTRGNGFELNIMSFAALHKLLYNLYCIKKA